MKKKYNLKFVSRNNPHYPQDETDLMYCPICGGEWTHLEESAYIVSGQDDYKAHPLVRGNVVMIHGKCEDGCKFVVLFGQHKGMTKVWAEELT
jgi:hypothetical protein